MNKVIEKTQMSDDVYSLKIEAPLIAREHQPGQFVIIMTHEYSERIPLTIADTDKTDGFIRLIFQAVGKSTNELAKVKDGYCIAHILGPLGNPSHITRYNAPVICIGGGIGTAPLYPIAKAFKEAGNKVIVITGARTHNLLILQEEMAALADEFIICTDDGSAGQRGLVTGPLQAFCETLPAVGEVMAIGPPVMMQACAETTRKHNIKTTVSLNTIMIDGTGMCGGCRVGIGNTIKFVCVDGPEFDAHQVDWLNMRLRLTSYKNEEEQARHACRIGLSPSY
jgi:ferredoxin--NADP+ reductase